MPDSQSFRNTLFALVAAYLTGISFQNQMHRLRQAAQTFLLRLALAISPGHFHASRPKAALVKLTEMQDVSCF